MRVKTPGSTPDVRATFADPVLDPAPSSKPYAVCAPPVGVRRAKSSPLPVASITSRAVIVAPLCSRNEVVSVVCSACTAVSYCTCTPASKLLRKRALSNTTYGRCNRCWRLPTTRTVGHAPRTNVSSSPPRSQSATSSRHTPYVACHSVEAATTTGSTPCSARARASAKPAGPPPTMATSTTTSSRWSGIAYSAVPSSAKWA